jgi:pyrroloquinoline quinone biosynthesis protein B
MMKRWFSLGVLCIIGHQAFSQGAEKPSPARQEGSMTLTILGIAQDGGYPQIGCRKPCCEAIRKGTESSRHVTSLAITDARFGKYWLWEATPDMPEQLNKLQSNKANGPFQLPEGIFLTHGHIGHYTGLMHLGREAYGAKGVDVFAMPRMKQFLSDNGPWSQLITLGNINIRPLKADSTLEIAENLKVTPLRVPHRDEFTETVGFLIHAKKKVLFIPDIDKWEKWNLSLDSLVREVDLALIDGTFFDIDELPGRDMREIPHPFVTESMQKLSGLPKALRNRVMFIHFNHTNPLIRNGSLQAKKLTDQGFRIAREGWTFEL